MMAKTVTLRLSDSAYEAVKQYAEADHKSMNSWIVTLLDAEDMRRDARPTTNGYVNTLSCCFQRGVGRSQS